MSTNFKISKAVYKMPKDLSELNLDATKDFETFSSKEFQNRASDLEKANIKLLVIGMVSNIFEEMIGIHVVQVIN